VKLLIYKDLNFFMKESDLISDGAAFVIKAFKREGLDKEIYYHPDDLELFLGTIAGLIHGMAEIVAEKDSKLYIVILDAMERLALK
jgi:ABC-type protease/lipase transport system fused ATPase/permease subunit